MPYRTVSLRPKRGSNLPFPKISYAPRPGTTGTDFCDQHTDSFLPSAQCTVLTACTLGKNEQRMTLTEYCEDFSQGAQIELRTVNRYGIQVSDKYAKWPLEQRISSKVMQVAGNLHPSRRVQKTEVIGSQQKGSLFRHAIKPMNFKTVEEFEIQTERNCAVL